MNQRWTVEARIFNNGKIIARTRPAKDDDLEGCIETEKCDIWIDLFDSELEARQFAKDYKCA